MESASAVLASIQRGQNILSLLTYFSLALYMWPPSVTVEDGSSFDFVIVGGGTAGCLLAGNLARLNVTVLLIEAGSEPTFETTLPGLFFYSRNTELDWNFTSIADESSELYRKSGVSQMTQGRVLGGSGQVNYMLYDIGHPEDYDEWAALTNDSNWAFQNVCPLFKRTEKLTDKVILNSHYSRFHGTEGKLKIRKYRNKINDKYFESYEELGWDVVNDINPHRRIGFTDAYFTIGSHMRQSTAQAFLSPIKDSPYLKVMLNSLATNIIFDENKKAIGVRVLTKDKKYVTVKAKNEIIITAGAINSPKLLMLSGVGPKEHLESKDIEVISDLPVGQNFMDNPTSIMVYGMGPSMPVSPHNPFRFPVSVMDGFVAIDKNQRRADYQILSGVIADPRFLLQVCVFVFNLKTDHCDRLFKSVSGRQVHFVTHNLLYPKSRGEILLNSSDPEDKPLIDPGYYSDEEDLERHAEFVEHFNAIINTTFYKSVGAKLVSGLESCDRLKYGSREYWKCFVLGMGSTLHNYAGTCAMGAVLDPELRVKGVTNLRVADASIMPKIVGSTLQATVMMIAQMATDLLVTEYKL